MKTETFNAGPEIGRRLWGPARPYVTVIVPALNEEIAIARVLSDLPWHLVHQVLVVDNGSTDATAHVAKSRGAQVIFQPEQGYGAACLAGLQAMKKETDIVVFLDGDYSDFPGDMSGLLSPILRNQADLVIGTRTLTRDNRSGLTLPQRCGNWLATTLIRLRFGYAFTDLGPFRAIRKEALDRLAMSDRNFGWTVEMQIKALMTGLRIVEVPVRYRPRTGKSKISGTLKGVVLAGTKILYTIFRYSLLARN